MGRNRICGAAVAEIRQAVVPPAYKARNVTLSLFKHLPQNLPYFR